MNKHIATNIGKNKLISIEWYVLHHKFSISQEAVISKQILSKTPTEFKFVECSVFMKEVNTQNFWTFELGTQEGIIVSIWIVIGFEQRDIKDSQHSNKDTFHRPPVTSAQGNLSKEKDTD